MTLLSDTNTTNLSSVQANGSSQHKPEHEEHQYLSLIREILANGAHRPDRTGTGTYSLFSPTPLRFSLRNSTLPLLTTKRVFHRGVLAELLWFIAGSTSSLPLSAAGVSIWDPNGSRAYLDSLGFTSRAIGDLGPVYGFQWRHFGAEYRGPDADYTGEGVDQLAEVVRKLKENPFDRRIILSAWNPKDLGLMALPPCHMFAQFYVSYPNARRGAPGPGEPIPPYLREEQRGRGELQCVLYQRSCDMGLGVPFNIASYALLTHILAHACDLEAGELVHHMGDAHVYADHVEALRVQVEREPREWPTVKIRGGTGDGRGGGIEEVDRLKVEDFEIAGYRPLGKIEMKMSV